MITRSIQLCLILFAFSLPFKLFILHYIPVLVFLLWLLEGNLARKWAILKRSPIFWLFVAITLLYFLSFLWSDAMTEGYFGRNRDHFGLYDAVERYGFRWLILPVMLTSVDLRRFKQIISAFLAAMIISEIASYGIFLHLWNIGRGDPGDPTPFLHHTAYSTFLVFTVFILLTRFHHEKERFMKYFYLLFALSAITNLFLNGGRTGQLAFLLCAVYFTLHHFRYSLKAFALMAGAISLILMIAYESSPVFQKRIAETQETLQKMEHHQYQTSFGQRVAIWQATLDILKEHPLAGAGIGDARSAIAKTVREHYPDKAYILDMPHVHNQFLQAYLETGLLGFVAWILFFVLFFRSDFYEYESYAKIYAISLLIFTLVDTPYHFTVGISYILFFTGLFFGYKNYRERVAGEA